MMNSDPSINFVAALNQSYRFEGDRIVFQDGVSYTIEEAVHIARDRLDDDDIQAIHLVKKLFDGEIVVQPGETQKVVYNAKMDDGYIDSSPVKKPKSLSSLAFELGPPPILNGSALDSY
jgi:hypothetical protein